MKQPDLSHPIEISPFGGRVRVHLGAETVADTSHALVLEEAGYLPVFYIPRGDVHMDKFAPSDLVTHCPYKGDASHYSIGAAGEFSRNAAWSYETPYPAVAAIAGHMAFYPDKVRFETLPFG